jgi:tetratricopeptide (TPR) repeat protein
MQEGRLVEAEAAFRAVLKQDPDNSLVLFNLGSVLEQRRQYDEAERRFLRALALNPDLVGVYLHLAQIDLARGNDEGAFRNYFEAYWRAPEGSAIERLGEGGLAAIQSNDEVREGIESAQRAIREGKPAEGEARIREVLEVAPENATLWNLLGIVLGIEGKYDDAIQAFRETVRLRPTFHSAWVRMGELLELKGDLEGGRETYETATLLQDNPVGAEAEEAEKHLREVEDRIVLKDILEQGDAFFKQGEYDAAARAYQAAAGLYPNDGVSYFKAGTALGRMNRLEAALSFFENGVEKNPNDAVGRQRIGQIQQAMHLFNRAEKSYREALARAGEGTLRNELQEALAHLPELRNQAVKEGEQALSEGKNLLKEGKKDEGLERLKQASVLNPEAPGIHAALARAYEERGEDNAAINALRGVIEFSPSSAWAYGDLARLYANQGLYAQALKELDKVGRAVEENQFSGYRQKIQVALSKANGREKPLLAESMRRLDERDLAGARQEARKAVSERPDDPEARALLAKIDEELGLMSDAKAEWETAGLLEPSAARYQIGLARFLETGGASVEAREAYEKAVRLARPEEAALSRKAEEGINRLSARAFDDAEVRRYTKRGLRSMKKGDYAAAERYFRLVVAIRPSDVIAQHELAFAQQRQGKIREAESGYRRAISLNPNFAEARFYLGGIYESQGKSLKAMEHFQVVQTLLSGSGTPEERAVKAELKKLERRYSLILSQLDAYDSNPNLSATPDSQFYSTLGINFHYALIKRQAFSLQAGFISNNLFYHTTTDAVSNNSFTLDAISKLSSALSLDLGYAYGAGWASGGISYNRHIGNVDLTWSKAPMQINLHYSYEDFISFISSSFNTIRTVAQLGVTRTIFDTDNVGVVYSYSSGDVADAVGSSISHLIVVSYNHNFSDKLRAGIGYTAILTRYTSPSIINEELHRKNVDHIPSVYMAYFIRPQINLSFSVQQEWNTSNLPALTSQPPENIILLVQTNHPLELDPYRRTVASASLSWTF